jgi:uncharacterized protein (TIGR02117 family)
VSRFSLYTLALLLALSAGCSSIGVCEADARQNPLRTIYVVKRGWHTGIAVAKADWPNRQWPVLSQFPEVDYLEFGWGDARFYQAERETLWLGLRAALWPTSSVVHVIGIRDPIAANADADELVDVTVSRDGLRALSESIEAEFASVSARPTTLSAAPAPNRFYDARGRFYFPRMCNWWTASRLHEAGCPITPWTVLTASRVMREAHVFAVCSEPVMKDRTRH